MAIQYLHDLNINYNELQNAKLHVTSSTPTAVKGVIYFDDSSGVQKLKFHDGSGWKTLETEGGDDNNDDNFQPIPSINPDFVKSSFVKPISFDFINAIEVDFRKDQLFPNTHGVVSGTVKSSGGNSPEISDTGDRNMNEFIEEIPHILTP